MKQDKILLFIKRHPFLLLAVSLLVFTFIQELSPGISMPNGQVLLAGILISAFIFTILLIGLKITGRLTPGTACAIIFIFAMILRLSYILYTGVYTRQQDVYRFGGPQGHAGYIEYLYTHYRLPDFDPRTIWQYYQPPLHHILVAAWLRLNTLAGIAWDQAKENIQILTLFYSGCYLIYTYRIFRMLLPGKSFATVVSFGIVALHPTFIILAGSINNDMLSILLLQASVFYAILWYRKPRMEVIVKLALAIGFGMMAKLSAGLIAPAVSFLFLYRFLTDLSARRKLAGQFATFCAICMPVGLWWGIRNLIQFGIPITYVPGLEETSHQYIGHYPVWVRLFDFSLYQLRSVYVAWGDPYFEHNIFIGLLKSSVFSEQTLSSVSSPFYRFAVVLFYINLIVVLLSLISMVYLLFRKFSACRLPLKIFIGLIYLTFMVFYIQFCFAYPHTCTQNIRYVTPAIWIGALAIGAASFLVRSDPSGSFRLRRNGGEV